MASRIEEAMQDRRALAEAEARERYPEFEDILVSFSFSDCIVDVKKKGGEWVRFQHVVEVDELAAEQAEAGTRIKRVVYGKPAA